MFRVKINPFSGRVVAVVGLFRTRCGLRRGAELMVRAFQAQGTEVYPVDISAQMGKPADTSFPGLRTPQEAAALLVTDIIIHMNPPQFAQALELFPRALIERACIVGYWAWELDVVPDDWRSCADDCDEIWVPSPFVAATMLAHLPSFAGALRVKPHPVDQDPIPTVTPAARNRARAANHLQQEDFVAGYSFALSSNYSRKNPTAAIDAFRIAFDGWDRSAVLLLRCHDAQEKENARLFAHLVSYAGDDPRVRIVDVGRTALPIIAFYHCLDVYLALFRSEGYGLNVVEAAQAGVPVIATGWGLAPDIMARPEIQVVDYRLIVPLDAQRFYDQFDGAHWASPDIGHAAALLKRAARWREAGRLPC